MAKMVYFDGLYCSDDEEFNEYLKKSYVECFPLLENICEVINERVGQISAYFTNEEKGGMAGGKEISEFIAREIRKFYKEINERYRDVEIFKVEEYQEKGCLNWIDTLLRGNFHEEDHPEVIGLSLSEFKEKYLSDLDVKVQLERLPDTLYNYNGAYLIPRVLDDFEIFCRYWVVDGFNKVLKHIRVNVDRLLSGKEVGFEDYQVAFDFAGTKSKIVNGANNIFQSLFSKRKVFINEDLYKKIEDDVIKKHKKADDIVNEIISNYYNGIKTENPAVTTAQQASAVEDDMAQIDAMLKSMNGEEVEAPVDEPTVEEKSAGEPKVDQVVEEKSQVSQEVVETLNSAKSSLVDSLDEEFRKLQESLGF